MWYQVWYQVVTLIGFSAETVLYLLLLRIGWQLYRLLRDETERRAMGSDWRALSRSGIPGRDGAHESERDPVEARRE